MKWGLRGRQIRDDEGRGQHVGDYVRDVADGRLMAAAPQMHEALLAVRAHLFEADDDSCRRLRRAVSAALRAAETTETDRTLHADTGASTRSILAADVPCPACGDDADKRDPNGHRYPGADADERGEAFFTSDCAYGCGCWMGGSRSGGPDGVDPFGACPNAPNEAPASSLVRLSVASVAGRHELSGTCLACGWTMYVPMHDLEVPR